MTIYRGESANECRHKANNARECREKGALAAALRAFLAQ